MRIKNEDFSPQRHGGHREKQERDQSLAMIYICFYVCSVVSFFSVSSVPLW